MATRINHKSDFTSYEQFTRYDKPVAVPERVRITYFTETGFPRCFVAERNGDILKNCSLSDDGMSLRVYVALSRQYIGTGPLKKIITETVEDANFPNGEKRLDSVAESNVVLWSGNSDNGLDTEDESELLPFRYGYSAYELAKIHGYEGTEEEYALAPLLAINELENYAKKDLSNVDEAEFAYKNVLPTSVWECRLDDDPETATPGIRDFWKMNMIELWEAANKQRRLLVKSTGIGTLVSPVSCSYVESPSGDRFVSAQIIFLGADDYVYRVNFDEKGSILYQSYWSHTEFATKKEMANITPVYVIDLGEYSSSEGFVFTDPLLSELAAAINAVSEGKATLLLKGSTPYGDPLFFSGVSVRIDAGIDYRLTFLMSNGRSYWISFEAGYPDSVQQGFTEGGDSGTITSEAYTDNKDYKEI
ncbi:MAG TPA: hypothetical protein DHU85_04835 [Porphyromonadaceae bacterium]|jgi:hypothetical protein|nr:hypothetical protein [Porphyromonadaceae bacterium]